MRFLSKDGKRSAGAALVHAASEEAGLSGKCVIGGAPSTGRGVLLLEQTERERPGQEISRALSDLYHQTRLVLEKNGVFTKTLLAPSRKCGR